MCDPVSAAVISAVSTVYSGLASMNAANNQAQIAKAQAENQARVYEQNANLARDEAEATAKAGATEEQKLRDKVRQVRGSQNAVYGASGLSLASGTPAEVGMDTEIAGEQDANLLRKNYQRKKFALINDASNSDWQAGESRKAGEAISAAYSNQGKAAMFGSLLGAAGTVASKWDSINELWGSKSSPNVNVGLGANGLGDGYGASYAGWNAKKYKSTLFG